MILYYIGVWGPNLTLCHNLIYIMEVFIMERSSALFEKGGSDRIPYITSLMCTVCAIFQPPITRSKVTGWSYLSDPVLSS